MISNHQGLHMSLVVVAVGEVAVDVAVVVVAAAAAVVVGLL